MDDDPTKVRWFSPHVALGAIDAVQAVRDLHAQETYPYGREPREICGHCASLCHSGSGLGCEIEGDALWPCDTIKALDGV